MDTRDAEALALRNMQNYGLLSQGWTFKFDRAMTRLGLCRYDKKTISISKPLVETNSEDVILNTILHEIAHALTPGHGHDRVWRKMHISIGGNGQRCSSVNPASSQGRKMYVAMCINCRLRSRPRYRRSGGACARCCELYNGGRYSPKFALRWEEVVV